MRENTIIRAASGEQYRSAELLGAGATADVYRATRLRDQATVAVKVLRRGDYPARVRFQREMWGYQQFVACPYIVTMFDSDLSAVHPYIVLEYCGFGSARHNLGYFISDHRGTLALLTHVAMALEVIRRQGCLYRDVKPDNMLLTTDAAGHSVLKLGDAGLICLPGESGQPLATRTPGGTLPYMAPELFIAGAQYTSAAEVFAFGVTAHELLTGEVLRAGASVTTGPIGVRALIERMVAASPEARPSITDVRASLQIAHQQIKSGEQVAAAILIGGALALAYKALSAGRG